MHEVNDPTIIGRQAGDGFFQGVGLFPRDDVPARRRGERGEQRLFVSGRPDESSDRSLPIFRLAV